MEIWINPACSKCRTATAALDEAGVAYTVRRYLEDVPDVDELAAVVSRLGVEPWDIARPAELREAGIDLPREAASRGDWLQALVDHPRSIQRPIVVADDGTAVIARDPAALDRLVDQRR